MEKSLADPQRVKHRVTIWHCKCTQENWKHAVLCLVAQSCLTLWGPKDCSLQAPMSMRILQARILEWVAMPSSRGLLNPGLLHCRWNLYHLSHQGSYPIRVAYPFSSGSSWPRNWAVVFCTAGRFFTSWATQFSSVQLLSCVRLFATPWIAACQASLSITNSQSLPKPMPIESVMPSSHLILCHSLLLLPPIPPSIRVFSNESTLHIRWPKYWSFSCSISLSDEYPAPISFRMDWLDLLAVQGTLKSLLQHHGSKASILQCSAFFTVQLSQPYMTTGKTIALARRTFVGWATREA